MTLSLSRRAALATGLSATSLAVPAYAQIRQGPVVHKNGFSVSRCEPLTPETAFTHRAWGLVTGRSRP